MISISKTIWMFVLLLSVLFLAKQNTKSYSNTIFKQAQIRFDKDKKTPLEIRFSKNRQISVASFFAEYKKAYHLSDNYEFKAIKVFTDQLGQTHHRYKQYYKGIELTEVQYLIHEENGSVFYAHGKFIHNLDIDVNPALSEKEALTKALQHINADEYMWESPKNEDFLKQIQNNRNAAYYPKGELKISAGLKEKVAKNFRLVYRFDIFSQKPLGRYDVDVDAKTGEIVGVISRLHPGDVQGYGTTLYNGNVQITVSDTNFYIPFIPAHFHLNDWNAYGGSGNSWWMADSNLGNWGGYADNWYDVLDTDPISLTGTGHTLSFFHRYSAEPPQGAISPFDGWDGMNVRISTDYGATWQVLTNPTPAYTNTSLYSFGGTHGEGPGIPGWTGQLNNWTEVSFNLDSFSGQTVLLRFAFAADGGASTAYGDPNWFGWQIDNILVSSSIDTLFMNNGIDLGMTPKSLYKEVAIIPGNYRLREAGRVGGIVTFDALNQINIVSAVDFVDNDSNFTDTNALAGVSVHWGAEATYDYYLTNHSRNSYDNNGGRIISYAHFDINWNNAVGGGGLMAFGDGDGSNYGPLVSLDVVSHEYTHSVTQFSANLIYAYESGALNESFSDIFGTAVEFFVEGSNADWLIGEDFALTAPYFRSMSNPNIRNDPDTYLGNNWYTGTNDNGGVHTNSGVQNYWFYLLSEGGSGFNDNGDAYAVMGIGIEDAAQITYRNLTVYLMPSSEYYDSRSGSINAAIDLFGPSSQQVQSVINAWNAVGVYLPFIGPYVQNCVINASYLAPGTDTLIVNVDAINPNNHSLEVKTILESFNLSFSDTILMYDDGFHNDSTSGDGLFGGLWAVTADERNYNIKITTISLDSGYYNVLLNAAYFTTIGPVCLEKLRITSSDTIANHGDNLKFEFTLKNSGTISTAETVTGMISSLDTFATISSPVILVFGNIEPVQSVTSNRKQYIKFPVNCPDSVYAHFRIDIFSDEYLFWSDTFSVFVHKDPTGIYLANQGTPIEFTLKPNYPNPFNPRTNIEFQIANSQYVTLKIYNLLGQEVATLVSNKLSAGVYKYVWDASEFSSGIYYYKIEAGSFAQTRKLVLMK